MKIQNQSKIEALTQKLFEATFDGKYDGWLAHLSRDAVFVCSGAPTLIGNIAIKTFFDNVNQEKLTITKFDGNTIEFADCAQVYGSLSLAGANSHVSSTVYFSIMWDTKDKDAPRILLQHMFYEFYSQTANADLTNVVADMTSVDFIRNLMLDTGNRRFPIETGTRTLYINPASIIYVDSHGKKTEIVCIDKRITSNHSISQMQERLPDYFYPLRRDNIINLLYLVGIKCYEAELVSGIKIPIPERRFKQVKADIDRLMPLIKTKR